MYVNEITSKKVESDKIYIILQQWTTGHTTQQTNVYESLFLSKIISTYMLILLNFIHVCAFWTITGVTQSALGKNYAQNVICPYERHHCFQDEEQQ